jgi:hypothetical protein
MAGSHRPDARRPSTSRRPNLTRRGKVVAVGATVGLVAGALGYFALFPKQAPAFVRSAMQTVGITQETGSGADAPAPPTCPLTGRDAPHGEVPERPALAIKVENHPDSRPQAALNDADIVVEQPVEGGYTRFIAIYQCSASDRVGPVRSGRLTDPDYLRQFGAAVFGYAGGVQAVKREVPDAGLVDVNYIESADAYTRDSSRSAPHDLFTTTAALWRAGRTSSEAPEAVFAYATTWEGRSRRIATVHVPFSSVSDVVWSWSRREGAWLRAHGETPHTLEDGSQVAASTVVIQFVDVSASSIVDAAGNASPEVELTGSGRAYVLRDGRVIVGRWERDSLDDVTTFVAKDGTEIAFSPGRTWVELVPSTVAVELAR